MDLKGMCIVSSEIRGYMQKCYYKNSFGVIIKFLSANGNDIAIHFQVAISSSCITINLFMLMHGDDTKVTFLTKVIYTLRNKN